jgi:hypothetical protein
MATYWVISVTYEGNPRDHLGGDLYLTPFQADTVRQRVTAAAHRRNSNTVYGVREATWQEREAAMLRSGIYQPPVWSDEGFWQTAQYSLAEHHVHISLADPTGIAFTEDARKGEADRQTYMRPGKYLQKFLGAGPNGTIEYGPLKGEPPRVTKQQIAFYAAWHQTGKRPVSDDVLSFTDDEQEIVDAYENGPDSCMMGKGWEFANHPVRVYAAGDLSLAVLRNVDGTEVLGRALCWPAKGVFGRVYPTPNNAKQTDLYNELMARLKALGWTSVEEDSSVFEGARLQRIEGRWGDVLMPYLDHSYGVRERYRDGVSFFEMTLSEDHQENTDGTLLRENPTWECEECGDSYIEDEDDQYTVYSHWRMQSNNNGRPHGWATGDMTWCSGCRENHAFYCEGSEEYYSESGADRIDTEGGETYEVNWFNAHGGYTCQHSEQHFLDSEEPMATLGDGTVVASKYLEDAAFECQHSGEWWPKDQESETHPGYLAGNEPEDEDEDELETEEA